MHPCKPVSPSSGDIRIRNKLLPWATKSCCSPYTVNLPTPCIVFIHQLVLSQRAAKSGENLHQLNGVRWMHGDWISSLALCLLPGEAHANCHYPQQSVVVTIQIARVSIPNRCIQGVLWTGKRHQMVGYASPTLLWDSLVPRPTQFFCSSASLVIIHRSGRAAKKGKAWENWSRVTSSGCREGGAQLLSLVPRPHLSWGNGLVNQVEFLGLLPECGKDQWDCDVVNYYIAHTLFTSCNARRYKIVLQF